MRTPHKARKDFERFIKITQQIFGFAVFFLQNLLTNGGGFQYDIGNKTMKERNVVYDIS